MSGTARVLISQIVWHLHCQTLLVRIAGDCWKARDSSSLTCEYRYAQCSTIMTNPRMSLILVQFILNLFLIIARPLHLAVIRITPSALHISARIYQARSKGRKGRKASLCTLQGHKKAKMDLLIDSSFYSPTTSPPALHCALMFSHFLLSMCCPHTSMSCTNHSVADEKSFNSSILHDLTGKVEKSENQYFAYGGLADVYRGVYTLDSSEKTIQACPTVFTRLSMFTVVTPILGSYQSHTGKLGQTRLPRRTQKSIGFPIARRDANSQSEPRNLFGKARYGAY
jgi:hypothetical protein